MRIESIFLTAFLVASPAFSADSGCTIPFDAGKKIITTPSHGYSTRTSGPHPNQPRQTEVIHTGGMDGAMFVKFNGRWTHSPLTPTALLKQEDQNIRDAKSTCRYLRDESVSGEPAAVYSVHTDNGGIVSDGTIWIAKARGLPLKEELDMDVGGGPSGKSHESLHFEYSNIRPPDGVK